MDIKNESDRPVLDRINTEYEELAEKIEKLEAFINGDIFGDLDTVDQVLLRAQLGAMNAYLGILRMRLYDAGYYNN